MKRIRLAEQRDTQSILDIYEPYITDSTVSFEEMVPTVEEFWQRVHNVLEDLPWLVCEIDGIIAGYAYASHHRKRTSYRLTKEVSVYVHPDFHKRRIATALYSALVEILKLQGVTNILAGTTLPNEKSVLFHKSFGFQEVGIYHNIGYKKGSWHDVMWLEMSIGSSNPPKEYVADYTQFLGFLDDYVELIR